jgi:hypothetical protein
LDSKGAQSHFDYVRRWPATTGRRRREAEERRSHSGAC